MIRPPSRVEYELLQRHARPAPYLAVYLTYEGSGAIRVVAETREDEVRLVSWLQRAEAVRDLGEIVGDIVDRLCEENGV